MRAGIKAQVGLRAYGWKLWAGHHCPGWSLLLTIEKTLPHPLPARALSENPALHQAEACQNLFMTMYSDKSLSIFFRLREKDQKWSQHWVCWGRLWVQGAPGI